MVFRGKPSKACDRCRQRRLRVSYQLEQENTRFIDGLRSATNRSPNVVLVCVLDRLARDTETRMPSVSAMKQIPYAQKCLPSELLLK